MAEDEGSNDGETSEKSATGSGSNRLRIALYVSPILIILVVAIVVIWPMIMNTPVRAVERAGKAALEHDIATLGKYVDLETVISRALSDISSANMPEFDATGDVSGMGMDEFGDPLLELGFMAMMEPEFSKTFVNGVETAIETGELDLGSLLVFGPFGGSGGSNEPIEVFDLLEDNFQLKNIREIERDGKIATVRLNMIAIDSETPFELDILLRDSGDNWQIAEFSNISELDSNLLGKDFNEELATLMDDPFGMSMFDPDSDEFGFKPCSEKSATEDAEAATQTDGEWTEVFTASGKSEDNTDEFTITNSPFKVSWEVDTDSEASEHGHFGEPEFAAFLFCAGTNPMMGMPSATVTDGMSAQTKGSSEIYDSGAMYLNVMAMGQPWKITVEERR